MVSRMSYINDENYQDVEAAEMPIRDQPLSKIYEPSSSMSSHREINNNSIPPPNGLYLDSFLQDKLIANQIQDHYDEQESPTMDL